MYRNCYWKFCTWLAARIPGSWSLTQTHHCLPDYPSLWIELSLRASFGGSFFIFLTYQSGFHQYPFVRDVTQSTRQAERHVPLTSSATCPGSLDLQGYGVPATLVTYVSA
ncbi:hypothetical protein XAP6164_190004 [Xanthomonas phaseoli pv. phaseoli]|nr:hypothetical protein XAP6164_190004 [Xanthomonas phaseoli pv. phaseoli]